MEGNGKKCDFGQNCKNKALNTLTNCSNLTINHLRYLKSNSKELGIAENYLINIWIVIFANNIVMSSVSIGPDRGIDAVMSREIWFRLQLVAICEGNLQNHTSYICIGLGSPDINTSIFIFTRWIFILEWRRNQACLGN